MPDDDTTAIDFLCQHVVSFVGTYALCEPSEREHFETVGVPPHAGRQLLSFTGTPVQLLDTLYIVTAGHIFSKHVPIIESQRAFLTGGSLADCFGPTKTQNKSFPFNLFESVEHWVYEPSLGLDYAMIRLSENDAELVRSNAIVPYAPSDELYKFAHDSDKLLLLGFPEENAELTDWSPGGMSHIRVVPSVVPVKRLKHKPTELYPWICGEIIHMGNLNSIVGISGGPLFATKEDDTGGHYTVAGIQSSWNSRSRTIQAMGIDCIVDHFWKWKKENAG
jgi:hypothetical protein